MTLVPRIVPPHQSSVNNAPSCTHTSLYSQVLYVLLEAREITVLQGSPADLLFLHGELLLPHLLQFRSWKQQHVTSLIALYYYTNYCSLGPNFRVVNQVPEGP